MSPSVQGVSHVDTEAGFEVLAPDGWTFEEIKFGDVVAAFNSPDDAASVNVGGSPAQGMTLEEWSEVSKESALQLLSNFELLREEAVSVGGEDARILEATVGQTVK